MTAVTVGESLNARHFFTSYIYNDARLSVYGEHERKAELFVRQGADGRPRQLTFGKMTISGWSYDPVGGQVIFASATVKDDSFGFVPAINAPGKFSGFRFYRIDLTDPNSGRRAARHPATDRGDGFWCHRRGRCADLR